MKKLRRNHTAAHKAKVASAALKGNKPLAKLSGNHEPRNERGRSEEQANDDVVVLTKQSARMFFFTELGVYISQIIMFFFVAVLGTNLLRDEALLVSYWNSKVNDRMAFDFWTALLALVLTWVIIFGITWAAPKSSGPKRVADEVWAEAPKLAYLFGSSVAGTILAVVLYLNIHPQLGGPSLWELALNSGLWAALLFGSGYGLACVLRSKEQIKKWITMLLRKF